MKNKIAALLLAVLALLTAEAVRADLIWYEPFNYTNGDLSTVSSGVWSNFSGSKDLIVTNNTLQVGSTSGTLSRSGDECRFLGHPYDQSLTVLYASFTMTATNLPQSFGTYFAAFFKDGTPGGFSGRINSYTNAATTPGTFRLGCTGNAATTNAGDGGLPIDLALNTTYQVVARLDPINLQACTIWINPISEDDTQGYTSRDSIGFAKTNGFQLDAFSFRQASSAAGPANNWFCVITNLALATSFQEALTNIQPTNAVAPIFAVAPVGLTNFTHVPATIFGVVNGQGQRSIVYQWFKDGNAFSNPAGNSPDLAFNDPAATDSGSYSLVATTPYGLSVTSAPVNVLFSDQPVAPKITSGPNSQSAFVGQNVTFSVNITSPGNVSFQWKSNNVDIPGANNQSLILTDVQTNFSASYSVGVTNDVFPTGVVSSNAVLTVSPAQKVSIAFVRTLVDPVTFAPTNVPPTIPYTVTGVVTTFTNITSGNTSSYYLQDATAGINIFVTFATSTDISGFRPQRGDVVQFTGVVSQFGGLELDADTNGLPQTSYEIISNNAALPAALVEPFNFTNTLSATVLNEQIAGSLVTLTNVFFGTNAGLVLSTSANQTITVTNAAGQSFGLAFFDLDLDTAGQTLPASAFSVTGALQGGITSPFTLVVSKFSDIVTNNPVITPVPLTVSSIGGGKIVLTWSNPALILESSTNVTGPYSPVAGATSPFTNVVSSTGNLFFLLSH